MSQLRPECTTYLGTQKALPNDTALFLIKESVERRGELIYGKLDDGKGHYCAIGSFWADNPGRVLSSALIDEVAAVNDAVPPTSTPQERWKTVRRWLRWKIKVLGGAKV